MTPAPAVSSSPRDTISDGPRVRRVDATWVMQWTALTLTAASLATILDAILLQYRRSYFTGGFLASDYVTRPIEAFAFLTGSLITDMAVIGLAVWAALWLAGRFAIRRPVALAGAFVLALVPILVADFVEYQLLTYLGDAFDLRLLFDLSGRNPGEIAAVSSAHVIRMLWLGAGIGAPAAFAVWMTLRHLRPRSRPSIRVPAGRSFLVALTLFVAGTAAMTLLRNSSDVLDNGLRRKPTGRILGLVVEAATDLDADGYGILGRPDDPRLFDGTVRPYALDLPGNGIDEDGVGGDLPSALGPY